MVRSNCVMRRLILLRHAKSSWADPDLADHDRPLNARGRAAAALMGGWMTGRGDIPDHVLLSDSARTIETWALARPALPTAPEGAPTPRLYHADPATMLSVLHTAPAEARTVLLIGHQPGVGGFARKLSNGAVRPSCARAFSHYPTGAAAVLDFEIDDWKLADWGGARFTAFVAPKEIG